MARNADAERPGRDEDKSEQNFSLFKECLASRVFLLLSGSDSEDLEEFSHYLAEEGWAALPTEIQEVAYNTSPVPEADEVSFNILPSFTETLAAYGLIPSDDADESRTFLRHVLSSYVSLATRPLPTWSSTRTTECEICSRAVPLTYHHLIPRATHARVLKRGWHPPEMLNSVAWLCRPCHSTVHAVASNDGVAKDYYTVEKLVERSDIQKWAKYASKQRWGARRG